MRTGDVIRLPCPLHNTRGKALCVSSNPAGKALWHCHGGCDSGDVRAALVKMGILIDDGGPRIVADNAFRIRDWLRWTVPATASEEARAYFQSRGLDLRGVNEEDLLWSTETHRIIAVVRDALQAPIAVHTITPRTRAKRTHGSYKGGAVRLYGVDMGNPMTPLPDDAEVSLAVAEGIETAMSYCAISGIPTWATVGSGGMKSFQIPERVTKLTAAADFDGVGLQAAEQLLRRSKRQGVESWIAIPGGTDFYRLDFNDIIRREHEPRDNEGPGLYPG